MIQTGVIHHLQNRMDGARLRVIGTVHQAADAGMNCRSRAHSARLNCSKQFTAFQAVVADRGTGLTQRNDLGVGGGIGIGKVAIAPATDDLAVTNYDGAHWNFSRLQRALGRAESFPHEQFV
jgi:hypothetical protein